MNEETNETPQPPVVVSAENLSPEALAGIIDNFILREGTDYGSNELTHESKVQRIHRQLSNGAVKIVFDPMSETVSLVESRFLQSSR